MSGFTLHLLRHGEPEHAGRLIGRSDVAPLPTGIAACVAQARDLRVEAVISSDLRRASSAGAAIGAALALPVSIDARWRELDFGAWEDQLPADLDSAALGRFWDDPDADPPPGGERWSVLVARVGAALHDLPARPTLVVTHAGAIRAALTILCGFDQRRSWAFELGYAALISLCVWPGPVPAAQIVALRP